MTFAQPQLISVWPRWWRIAVTSGALVILCSCQGPQRQRGVVGSLAARGPMPQQSMATSPGASAPHAVAAAPKMPPRTARPGGDIQQVGYLQENETAPAEEAQNGPYADDQVNEEMFAHLHPQVNWAPDGIERPWPADEWLHDGGDGEYRTRVTNEWKLYNVEPGDTIAHYETVEGKRYVEPSNKVCLYAPRFGAVRQVLGPEGSHKIDSAVGVHFPERLNRHDELQIPLARQQNEEPIRQVTQLPPLAMLGKQIGSAISQPLRPISFHDGFKPYEDLSLVRRGVLELSDKPFLAKAVDAAISWTHNRRVQVVIDKQPAVLLEQVEKAEEYYTVHERKGPQLRVCKLASKKFAEPGEFVDFTLRYDNVGNEVLGNVVLVDNLVTRLEFVPDTAQSSRKAEFNVEENEGQSLALRWVIDEPIKPGEGGVIRFRCRVR